MDFNNIENENIINEETLKGFEKFQNKDSRKKKKSKIIYILVDWLIALGIAIILTILITSVVSQGKVSGKSMNPTYENGKHILVQRIAYDLDYGDVITFWADKSEKSEEDSSGMFHKIIDGIIFHKVNLDNKELHIKRVVALPGDHVVVKTNMQYEGGPRSEVYVNDELIAASNIEIAPIADLIIKDGEYYVLGDNYDNSLDSRYHGPIKEEDVFGRVINGRENAREINEDGEVVAKEIE